MKSTLRDDDLLDVEHRVAEARQVQLPGAALVALVATNPRHERYVSLEMLKLYVLTNRTTFVPAESYKYGDRLSDQDCALINLRTVKKSSPCGCGSRKENQVTIDRFSG